MIIKKTHKEDLIPYKTENETESEAIKRLTLKAVIQAEINKEIEDDVIKELKHHIFHDVTHNPTNKTQTISAYVTLFTHQEQTDILDKIEEIESIYNGIGLESHLEELKQLIKDIST